eukprot:scaffold277_cov261-Pinguiococcus_pyrenoidosus.AAC.17
MSASHLQALGPTAKRRVLRSFAPPAKAIQTYRRLRLRVRGSAFVKLRFASRLNVEQVAALRFQTLARGSPTRARSARAARCAGVSRGGSDVR